MALDIIFLSYDEPTADINFERLKVRFPYAKRVHGVKGIAEAHYAAANASETRLFYVVDGDTEVLDSFDFSFKPPKHEQEYVHIWNSRNPVNGLVYGYGGVKLFSKNFFKDPSGSYVDFTTTRGNGVIYHDDVASVTHFNSDEFRSWRAAFRECSKLALQTNEEAKQRLQTWQEAEANAFYRDFVLNGASAGAEFGRNHPSEIEKVNDFNWLKEQFNKEYHAED